MLARCREYEYEFGIRSPDISTRTLADHTQRICHTSKQSTPSHRPHCTVGNTADLTPFSARHGDHNSACIHPLSAAVAPGCLGDRCACFLVTNAWVGHAGRVSHPCSSTRPCPSKGAPGSRHLLAPPGDEGSPANTAQPSTSGDNSELPAPTGSQDANTSSPAVVDPPAADTPGPAPPSSPDADQPPPPPPPPSPQPAPQPATPLQPAPGNTSLEQADRPPSTPEASEDAVHYPTFAMTSSNGVPTLNSKVVTLVSEWCLRKHGQDWWVHTARHPVLALRLFGSSPLAPTLYLLQGTHGNLWPQRPTRSAHPPVSLAAAPWWTQPTSL